MTAPVTVPQVPPLRRVPNVELLQTGTWDVSTGVFDFTVQDLSAAVAALGCPAVRRPVLKIGHTDPRFSDPEYDGEPALGWIDGMATADNGRTLVGDYVGIPGWLGEVMASAYPDRSIEGEFDYRCQMGHTHPFVVHAVALLGVERPGCGTLASLQDVAALYGVELAATAAAPTGTRVVVVKGTAMPNPHARQVAASVSSIDVTRAFYASDIGKSWDIWIEELQLDPIQLIYIDDSDNNRYRVLVIIGEGDGTDAVSFGEPVRVVIRYEDAPTQTAAAAAPGQDVIRFASRAESRPGTRPTRARAAVPAITVEGSTTVAFTDDQLATMRQQLGLPGDADEDAILAAIAERTAEPDQPAAPELPEGVVAIDAGQLEALQVAARRGDEARARQEQEDREAQVLAAIADGRIAPARREHWIAQLAADAGAAQVLANLAPGLIPVDAPIGHAETGDDALYTALFGKEAPRA